MKSILYNGHCPPDSVQGKQTWSWRPYEPKKGSRNGRHLLSFEVKRELEEEHIHNALRTTSTTRNSLKPNNGTAIFSKSDGYRLSIDYVLKHVNQTERTCTYDSRNIQVTKHQQISKHTTYIQ